MVAGHGGDPTLRRQLPKGLQPTAGDGDGLAGLGEPLGDSVLRRSGSPYTLSTRELGRRSLVTAGAVSQRVARAEREGLIVRESATGRPRAVRATLTTDGHRLVEETVDHVLRREAELLRCLDPEAQEQLASLLGTLLGDLQQRLGDDRVSHVGQE